MLQNVLATCETASARVLRSAESRRWVWFGIFLPVVLALHLFAAGQIIARSNQDFKRADQGAEMWLAGVAAYNNDWWPRRSDGVRHPAWSWLARFVMDPDDGKFFEKGKWLNTGVACVFLVALGVMATRFWGGLVAANVLLLSSMGILLVRATYFQPEPLYYAFSFFAAAAAWQILRQRGWFWYPVLGVLAGFAYLSKPSFEPFLLALLFALGIRTLLQKAVFPPLKDMFGILMVGAIVLLMALPLGLNKAELFGSPTFSYPKIWMWMDDFDTEAWPWQDAHPGRAQLEKVPPDEIPSFTWYFDRHTIGDAVARTFSGSQVVLARFFFPETRRTAAEFFWKNADLKKWEQPLSHRGVYLILLFLVPLALLAGPKIPAASFSPPNVACAAYAFTAFALYALLYGWYYPIGRGDRFMGSLWIPCIVLAAFLGVQAWRHSAAAYKNSLFFGVHAAILVSLLLQGLNLALLLANGAVLTTRN